MSKLKLKCNRCGNVRNKYVERMNLVNTKQLTMSEPCPNCGATDSTISEKDIVDELEELSQRTGTRMEVISSKTEEGIQLASLGGVGGILRFMPR